VAVKKSFSAAGSCYVPYASVSSVVDGAFSIGASQVPATIRYIENQPQRHRKVSLNEEWELVLRKHAMFVDRA